MGEKLIIYICFELLFKDPMKYADSYKVLIHFIYFTQCILSLMLLIKHFYIRLQFKLQAMWELVKLETQSKQCILKLIKLPCLS